MFWRWLRPENPNAYLDSWDWISLPTCPTGGFLVMFSLENSIQSLTWEMRELVSPQPSRTLFLENCQALCLFCVHVSKSSQKMDADWDFSTNHQQIFLSQIHITFLLQCYGNDYWFLSQMRDFVHFIFWLYIRRHRFSFFHVFSIFFQQCLSVCPKV